MRGFTGITLFIFASAAHAAVSIRHFTPADYIEQYKTAAVLEMKRFNIPASITLAQAIVESKYGNSDLAMNANNHFGIKCHKEWAGSTYAMDDDVKNECFRKYEIPIDSYEDHSMFLASRPRYAKLFELSKTNYIAWAKGLKEAGYATQPRYSEKLIEIIERYKLYELDKSDLNPVLYAECVAPHKRTERRYTNNYLFYVLKYNEIGFAVPRHRNSFFDQPKKSRKSTRRYPRSTRRNTNKKMTAPAYNPALCAQDVAVNRKRRSEEIISHVERRK